MLLRIASIALALALEVTAASAHAGAHHLPRPLPPQAQDFEALGPAWAGPVRSVREVQVPDAPAGETATGGPVGGIW